MNATVIGITIVNIIIVITLRTSLRYRKVQNSRIAFLFFCRETKVVSTPEKKVVEEVVVEKKKEKVVEKVVEEVEEVDEDSKASENGGTKEAKENGSSEEKEADEKEAEPTENGDSTGKYTYIS